jgi:hypothetical protein
MHFFLEIGHIVSKKHEFYAVFNNINVYHCGEMPPKNLKLKKNKKDGTGPKNSPLFNLYF